MRPAGSSNGWRPEVIQSLRKLLPDTRPLSYAPFRRVFLARFATVIGTNLTAVAVQQQIFDLTNSSAWVGIASVVALVPLVVFGLFGGALADTFDRRKVLMVTSVGIALTSIGLWVAGLFAGHESVWVVMGLLALQQGFFAVNQPTQSAILPRIVPKELLPSANALSMGLFSIGVIIGPLLAGILIPAIGLPWLYFIDALSLTAILPAVMKLPAMPRLGDQIGRARVTEGLNYLRTKPLLLMTFVVDIIAMVCGMPRALFPQMAEQTFGDPRGGGPVLGLLNAALAIGALLGSLTTGWVSRVHRQGIAIVLAIAVWGVSMALGGATSWLWFTIIFLAIGGWADLVSAVYRSSLLQSEATDQMRGRMQGVFTVVVAGGPRLADLVHGVVASVTSTQFAVVGGGVLCVIGVFVAALLGRSLWRYDARIGHPTTEPVG